MIFCHGVRARVRVAVSLLRSKSGFWALPLSESAIQQQKYVYAKTPN